MDRESQGHNIMPQKPKLPTDCHQIVICMAHSNIETVNCLLSHFCYNLNGALGHGCPIIFYLSSCTRLASMPFVKEHVYTIFCTYKALLQLCTAIVFNLSEVFVAKSACLCFLIVVFGLHSYRSCLY